MKNKIKRAAFSTLVLWAVISLNSQMAYTVPEYVLGEGDVIEVIVRQNEDLTRVLTIRPDGKISFPLLGDVQASGLTPTELKENLTRDLTKYIQLPNVTVIVQQARNYKVSVLGGGVEASIITLPGPTPLLQLLIQLRLTERANLKEAYIIRDNQKLPIDFYALAVKGDISQNITIEPNDVIFIPPSDSAGQIQIVGEVNSPQTIPYRPGLKILDVILQAGGLTEYASANKTKIIRKNGDKTEEIKVKVKDVLKGDISKNITLQPGDLIVVPQSWF